MSADAGYSATLKIIRGEDGRPAAVEAIYCSNKEASAGVDLKVGRLGLNGGVGGGERVLKIRRLENPTPEELTRFEKAYDAPTGAILPEVIDNLARKRGWLSTPRYGRRDRIGTTRQVQGGLKTGILDVKLAGRRFLWETTRSENLDSTNDHEAALDLDED